MWYIKRLSFPRGGHLRCELNYELWKRLVLTELIYWYLPSFLKWCCNIGPVNDSSFLSRCCLSSSPLYIHACGFFPSFQIVSPFAESYGWSSHDEPFTFSFRQDLPERSSTGIKDLFLSFTFVLLFTYCDECGLIKPLSSKKEKKEFHSFTLPCFFPLIPNF